jgi:hypothetical protein
MVQAPDGRADKRTGGAAERRLSETSSARKAAPLEIDESSYTRRWNAIPNAAATASAAAPQQQIFTLC